MKHEETDMPKQTENTKDPKNPNEVGGFNFEGHIKIFDPETGEVFEDKRNAQTLRCFRWLSCCRLPLFSKWEN